MTLALISDIHANLEALEAVLRDIESREVDRIICLGDIVGYGCNPVECLDLVDKHSDVTLMGNHEYVALGLLGDSRMNGVARFSSDWTRRQLSDRELSMMADFEKDHSEEDTYFVHSSPFEPDQWHYILQIPDAQLGFEHFSEAIGFFGHSHLPTIFSLYPDGECANKTGHDIDPDPDNRYLINVGSVGQPRDNDPRACYATFDPQTMDVRYHRIEYDLETTCKKMVAANMHSMLVDRLLVGR